MKIPQRMCVSCRKKCNKTDLIRISKKDDMPVVDNDKKQTSSNKFQQKPPCPSNQQIGKKLPNEGRKTAGNLFSEDREKIEKQRQEEAGGYTRGRVVQHDAPGAGEILKLAYGPGLQDVEETVEDQACDGCQDGEINAQEGQEGRRGLVDDN